MPKRRKAFTIKPRRGSQRKRKRLVDCKPYRVIRGKRLRLISCLGGRSDKTKGRIYEAARTLREEGFGSIYMVECKHRSAKTGRWSSKQCLYGSSLTERMMRLLKRMGLPKGVK